MKTNTINTINAATRQTGRRVILLVMLLFGLLQLNTLQAQEGYVLHGTHDASNTVLSLNYGSNATFASSGSIYTGGWQYSPGYNSGVTYNIGGMQYKGYFIFNKTGGTITSASVTFTLLFSYFINGPLTLNLYAADNYLSADLHTTDTSLGTTIFNYFGTDTPLGSYSGITPTSAGVPYVSGSTYYGTSGATITIPLDVAALNAMGSEIRICAQVGGISILPPVATAVTSVKANSFTANWNASSGAIKYYLDVATDGAFNTYVSGFQNKDVGTATSYSIIGLKNNTTYYYRVRAYNSGVTSPSSNTITQATLPVNNFLIEAAAGGSILTQTAGMPFGVKITARDVNGYTVTDYTGTPTLTSTSTLIGTPVTTVPFVAGVLSSQSVTLTKAGSSESLTATISSPSVTSTSTTFTVDPAAIHHWTLAADGAVIAGTPFTVTATVYDQYENIQTNFNGPNNLEWTTTATSSANGTARILPANGNQTFVKGVLTNIGGFKFFNSDQSQLTPNLSPTITIKDVSSAVAGTTAPITVLNAPLDNFKVVAGTTQSAGTPFSTTVTARDIFWNTCIDYAGNIKFKSDNDVLVAFPMGLQSFAPAATNHGVKEFTNQIRINTIGAYWLRAADEAFAYKSGEQQNIVVGPGAFSASTLKSIVSIDSSNKIAGEEVVVTLTPRDAQGNLLYSCQNLSVLLDGVVKEGTHQVANGNVPGSDGVYVFQIPVTSTTAANVITAKLGDVLFDQTYTIAVSPAPASLAHTKITPDAGTMTTNGTQTVNVQLYDQFDNLRTTNDGVVSVTTNLGGFGGNNGSQTLTATYNGTNSGNYSAILYASYGASDNGVGTAAITGSIAFNETAGPGVWSGAVWPANGEIIDGASVSISEGLPNLVTSTLVSDKSTMTTDGTATLTIQLKDFLGNLIVNNRGAVKFTSDRGVLSAVSYLSPGKYTATLTAGTTPVNGVGLATITGRFDGAGTASAVLGSFNDDVSPTLNTITTVDITEGLPAVAMIDISAVDTQITADGSTLVTVQLKDALGNLIVNNIGVVTLSTNLGVIVNGVDPAGPNDITANYTAAGQYTATFKMNGIGTGVATITGKYNTISITDHAPVRVINGVATQLAIATAPALLYQPIAGIEFNAQPVIYVKDQFGNLVITGTGSDATVTATRTTTGTAGLQGTTSKAAVAGVATFTNLSYNVAESINIQFTSGTLTDQTSAAINVVHNVPSYMAITGNATQTAGLAQTITVKAYDFYGNLANRFTGDKTLTFSGANQSPVTSSYPTVNGTNFLGATTVAFVNGVATASMNLYKEETADIAANFTNASYVDPAGFTVPTSVNINAALANRLNVVVAQAVPSYLAITGNANQVAGVAQTITIRAYDNFNNPATGYTGTKTLRFSGANSSLLPATSPTVDGVVMGNDQLLTFDNNGVATASMNLYMVESAVITATDQVSAGVATRSSDPNSQLAVNVNHAAASYYAVTGTGTQTAGAAQNITIKAYDAFNNQATTYAGDVAVTFSGANLSPNTPNAAINPTVTNKTGTAINFGTATTINFVGGTATRSMILTNVETAHIIATTGSITTPAITGYDYRLQVAVNHAANSYFAIIGNGIQTAGVSQDITLTMYDAYNNIATGYAGAKSLTFSGAIPSPNTPNAATNPIVKGIAFGTSTPLTFADGTVTTAMNLYNVETAQVTATDGTSSANTHKLTVVVSHADQNYMAITGTGTQTAGVPQNITVKAYDAFNNVATRFVGSKSLTFSGASISPAYSPTPATSPVVSATAFGTPTAMTFVLGVGTSSMNLYKVETASVTATNTDGSISITSDAHQLPVVVNHSTPAYLAITGADTQVAGSSQTVLVKAYDAFNNPATTYTGSKNLVYTGANPSAAAVAGNNMPTPTTPATNPTSGGTAFNSTKALTFANGEATISMNLYKTETALVSVTDGGISAHSTEAFDHRLSVAVTPALLFGFIVSQVPDPHDLGTWQPVKVEALDTYNNPKTDYVGKITFSNTNSDIATINPLDYQFLLAENGIHTFDNVTGTGINKGVKFSKTGLDWWLTAIDLAEPKKYGAQSGITVQRAVTIASTSNGQTKTYGDVKDLGTTEFTITDLVSGLPVLSKEEHGITGVTLTSAGSVATATVADSPYSIAPSVATGSYNPLLYRIVYNNAGMLTVGKRDLTLTNFLADAKTYDGTTTVTGAGFSDNRVNSDVLTFSKTVVFASRNAALPQTVNYSDITISGGAGAGNYTLLTTGATISANIAKRPINVTAQTDTKIYDGTTASSVLPVVDALQTPLIDLVTNPGIQTFDSETSGATKTITPGGTVINDGNGGLNYAITYVPNLTAVINQRPIAITIDANQTKVYGEANPALYTYTLTSGVLAGDDTFDGSLARVNGENVGTFAINQGSLTIKEGSTDKLTNYDVTYNSKDYTITSRPITLAANDKSKTYGSTFVPGTTEFTLTSGSYALTESANSVILASDGAINSAPVATYPITLGTATGNGGFLASNYNITYTPGTLTVDPKVLTVISSVVTTPKTYNGTTVANITGAALSGVEAWDGALVVLGNHTTGTYTQKDIGTSIVVNTLPMTITGSAIGNYTLVQPTGLVGTIVVKPITGSFTANNRVYDGGVDAEILTRTLTGIETIDAGKVTLTGGTAAFNNKNVADGKLVTPTGMSLTGTEAGNYLLTAVNTTTANVTRRTLTLSNFLADTKIYDQNTSVTGQGFSNDKVTGDALTFTWTPATFVDENYGVGKIVNYTNLAISGGADIGNYILASTTGIAHATIEKKLLTLRNFAANDKEYDGTTNVAFAPSFQDNRIEGDYLVYSGTAQFDNKNVGSTKVVTYSGITITGGADKNNYTLTQSGGATGPVVTISARPFNLIAIGVNKEFDGTDAATVTFTDSKIAGDDLTLNYTVNFDNKNVGTGKTVNVTGISLGSADALNYSVAATASTSANITIKTITISPDAGLTKLFGNADPAFTYTNSPALYSGDSFTGTLGRIEGEEAGNYNYTPGDLSAGPNYTLVMTGTPATFAITRSGQTIALSAGWNIISSGVIPTDKNMKSVFNPLISGSKLRKVMDESGHAIEDWSTDGSNWQNAIGNMSVTEGYRVNVTTACNLTISGSAVVLPLTIPLTTGWNIISYPASANQNGKTALQALITAGKIIKVMDERGYAIEDWTSYGFGWQNNLGDFTPGKGYLVNVNGPCNLIINEVLNKAATITPEFIASTHFITAFTGNGLDHMNINLMELNKSGIRQGDEIGIFDGSICVGAVTIGADQMFSGNVGIPVSANDGLSESINGYIQGNQVSLKLFSNGAESTMKTETLKNGVDVFRKGESLFMTVSDLGTTGLSDLSQQFDVKFYPNPFTDNLSIKINSSGSKPIDIMIYDVLGRKIRTLITGSVQGSQIVNWDGTTDAGSVVRPGVYYLRCNGLTFNGIIKR